MTEMTTPMDELVSAVRAEVLSPATLEATVDRGAFWRRFAELKDERGWEL